MSETDRKILREIEREDRRKEEIEEFKEDALRVLMILIAVLVGVMLWVNIQRSMTMEAEAAVLHRGSSAARPMYVEPIPEEIQEDGEPPEALSPKLAAEAEAIPEEWVSIGMFRTTGFCNCRKCCGKWAGGKTASGAYPVEGVTIAVDKKVIPLGTHVLIDGNEYIAQDTGSGIYGNRIDIYYDDHSRAWNHGVQYKEVYIRK